MAGVELATAYVSLNVRADAVPKQVRSAMESASKGVGRSAGDRLGTDMGAALQAKLASRPWVQKAMERANRGAGASSSRKFFDEFRTTSSRLGAVAGLVVGKTIGAGITVGMKTATLGGAMFAKLEVAARRTAVKIGSMMAAAIRSALATTGVGLGVAGVAGAGGTLLAGLDRLKTLQQAEVQLSLKLSPAEVKKVKQDVLSVIEGTPIALDQAMQAVPRALASGIKQGDELKQYIKDIGDTAASTGGKAGFGQIDLIFGQILGKGKLMGEELMQLTENGVDMRSALKEAFNWDDKTLQRNIEKGKVGMREVQIAVQKTWGKDGGLAKKMGETFQGATDNLKTSIAKLGANILGAIFGDPNDPDADPLESATKSVMKMQERLDDVSEWVNENRGTIHAVFSNAAKAVGAFAAVLGQTKSAATSTVDWLKRAWDNVTSAVTKTRDAVRSTVDDISQRLTDVVDRVKKIWDDIFGEEGWFSRQFKKIADLIGDVKEALGFGPATANAAPPGAAPFNPGPLAPGATAPLVPPGAAVGPMAGTILGADGNVPQASMSGRVPYGLPPGTDTGGYGTGGSDVFPQWVMDIADYFGIKPSTYSGHQQDNRQEAGYSPNPDNLNRGIDWVGPVENLQRFAEYLETLPDMEQVIWQNPNTGRKTGIAGGRDVSGTGYYDDNTYASHGGNDPNNIHVHTRQALSIPIPVDAPSLAPTQPSSGGGSWLDRFRDWAGFGSGGKVSGPGTGTSDSIPAMLSNGEHVLTAKDVKALGGQDGVYAFRAALQAGLIPGFNDGGGVDATKIQDQLRDLGVARDIANRQLAEVLENEEASEQQKLQAQIAADRANRAYTSYAADAPIIASGGTPPDRGLQEQVYATDEDLRLQQAQMDDLRARKAAGDAIPDSQVMAAENSLAIAQRNRLRTWKEAEAANAGKSGEQPDFLSNLLRTQGFTPSGGGGKAGTSSLAGFINMGSDVVGGLIDTGASLLQTATNAAITAGAAAGSFGAGAAAAPAASAVANYGIQLGAAQAKRISDYWFGMAGIGADALIAQLFPFGGPPRALGYDYTQMAPQLGIMGAATTTLEQMGQQAIESQFSNRQQIQFPQKQQPQQPQVDPAAAAKPPEPYVAPDRILQFGDPDFYNPPFIFNPWPNNTGAGGGGGGGSWAKGGHVGVYDQGGILEPGGTAVNLSTRPERVLTSEQWDAMNKVAARADNGPLVKIDAIYGMSPEDVANQIEAKQKLAAMRFTGRPY